MNSKMEQLVELAKIINDTPYALKTYLETYDNTQKKMVPLELFDDQVQLLKDYEAYNENITKKYRQAGVSTVTAAWVSKLLQVAKTDQPERVLIIANKRDTAIEMANKIRGFLSQWPEWMNVGFSPDKNSESRFKLNNGCEVKAVATSEDALRGYTPTILIFDEAAYIEAGENFWAASMASLSTGGKIIMISCVVKDTFVFTSKGLQQVNDFINNTKEIGEGYVVDDYLILGKDKLRQSNLLLNNGKQKTLKIKTVNSDIEGTENHKVWAYSNEHQRYDWFKFKELKLGDFLNVGYGFEMWGNNDEINFIYNESNKENNIFKPERLTQEICYLLGLILAEGSSYKNYKNDVHVSSNITITCGDDLNEILTRIGIRYTIYDGLHYSISSKSFTAFLEYLGFDLSLKAKNKVIPSRLLEMSKENIKYLLKGIFDGDGFSDSTRARIGIGLASEKMVKQIRMLLLNFGILTDWNYFRTKKTKKVSVESDNYRITTSSYFTRIFYEVIGFGFKRKQDKSKILEKYIKNKIDSFDIIPNVSFIIKSLIKKYNLKRKHFIHSKRIYDNLNKTTHLTRSSFVTIINEISFCDNFNEENIFDKILFSKSKWCKITKIEESENETFDFSLYNDNNDFWCHSIYYNGILGHQTPNGFDPIYYGVYAQSKKGVNDFHITELTWYHDPRYTKDIRWIKTNDIVHYMLSRDEYNDDEVVIYNTNRKDYPDLIQQGYKPFSTWFESMSKKFKYDRRRIAQELECDFLGSGDSVIPGELIERILKTMVKTPNEKYIQGTLWCWKEPVVGHRYIMGCDVSRGDSEDYSAINIIDFDTREQVMEYIGKMPPDDLASLAYKWGILYSAFIVVDITGGMGVATSRKLQELNYKNMYIDGINVQNVWEYDKKLLEKIPGINFNNKRVQIISSFEEQLRHGFIIKSSRLVNELNTFVFINNRPDHMKGAHDDSIMSIAIAMYCGEICFSQLTRSENQNKAMLDSWVLTERTYEVNKTFYSYGTSLDPIGSMAMDNSFFHKDNPQNIGKNAYQEYSWLFKKPKQ